MRPSGDRIRETLFSWLQPRLHGASCLDLFAGSGALGIEALSRGAGNVHLFEHNTQALANLQLQVEKLEAGDAIRLHHCDVMEILENPPESSIPLADIVFVDPPFADQLQTRVLALLGAYGWLQPGALVYVESPAGSLADLLPESHNSNVTEGTSQTATPQQDWRVVKEKRAGNVSYGLVTQGA